MSDQAPGIIEQLKGLVTFLREAIIVIVLILLLVFPTTVNSVLTKAGFTQASIAGFTWQRELEAAVQTTQDANQSVSKLENELQSTSAELEQIRTAANTPPAVREQISALSTRLQRTQSETRAVKDNLQNSLASQQRIMRQVAPGRR
jgi:septal ring factor EnvC (AmiA/AmiB activator)